MYSGQVQIFELDSVPFCRRVYLYPCRHYYYRGPYELLVQHHQTQELCVMHGVHCMTSKMPQYLQQTASQIDL